MTVYYYFYHYYFAMGAASALRHMDNLLGLFFSALRPVVLSRQAYSVFLSKRYLLACLELVPNFQQSLVGLASMFSAALRAVVRADLSGHAAYRTISPFRPFRNCFAVSATNF